MVEQNINKGRNQHATQSCGAGKDDLCFAGELPDQNFPLHFQADEDKENSHQPVVDPQQERFGDL